MDNPVDTITVRRRSSQRSGSGQRFRLLISFLLIALAYITACSADPPGSRGRDASAGGDKAADGVIVAMGDSLTSGLGVSEEQAYPARLERMLAANGLHFDVINAGVSGETSSGAVSRIEWVISSLKPDIIILATGANDGLRGIDPQVLETNLDQLIDTMKRADITIIFAGMRMLPNLGPEYIQAFAQIYPMLARKHGVIFMPFLLEGVAGNPALNQADRIHPTAEGYAHIVNNLYPYVIQAINERQGSP